MRTPAKIWILFFILFASAAMAQTAVEVDTIKAEEPDTVLIRSYTSRFNPRKALLYSAIAPGMGQVYNKKYWKLPIVYGGFYMGYFMINTYQESYTDFKNQLYSLLNDPNLKVSLRGYNQDQLRTGINKARRQRDFWCVLTGVWYMLQMVDAHVDAHLKEFDVNPQLKVALEPITESSPLTGRSTGLALKFKF